MNETGFRHTIVSPIAQLERLSHKMVFGPNQSGIALSVASNALALRVHLAFHLTVNDSALCQQHQME
jgi:hypothetical protein